MANIPSKQLHRVGDRTDLQNYLSEREIGFNSVDNIAYMKFGGELIPIGFKYTGEDGIEVTRDFKIKSSERATYKPYQREDVKGAIVIQDGRDTTNHKVSIGNSGAIGALVPMPEQDEFGFILAITDASGTFGWVNPDNLIREHFHLKVSGPSYEITGSEYCSGYTLPLFYDNPASRPYVSGNFIAHYDTPDELNRIRYVYLKPGTYQMHSHIRFDLDSPTEEHGVLILKMMTYFGYPAAESYHYVDSSISGYIDIQDTVTFTVEPNPNEPDEPQVHYVALGATMSGMAYLRDFSIIKI